MVVISTRGEIRRLLNQPETWVQTIRPDDRIRLTEGDVKTFHEIYASQPAVRTVLGFRARNLAALPMKVLKETNPNDFDVVKDIELARILRRPCIDKVPYDFLYALIMDLSIYDRTLWVKVWKAGRAAPALVRIPPINFEVIGDQYQITEFRVANGGNYLTYTADQVLYLEGYTPERNYGGVPPMRTLAQTIEDEASSVRYRSSVWKNGARMEHVITRPLEARRMSPDAKDRFWIRWNKRYSGATNAARTGMLEEGMDIKTIQSFSAKDTEYAAGRKFNIEEIARMFYIPPAALGILDGATYANMTAQMRQLYRNTFGPDIEWLQQQLLFQLGPADVSDSLSVYFDLGAKVEASLEELAPAIQSLTGGPVMTPNEGRTRLKLPDLEGEDELREVSGTVDPAAEDDESKPQLGTVTPVRRQQQGTGKPSVYRQNERTAG